MLLTDLMDERRSLEISGRRFVVRRPTVGAVSLFSRLFAAEIAQAFRDGYDSLPDQSLEGDPRLARVLAAFIEGDGDPVTWPLADLFAAVADIEDLPRIAESLRPVDGPGGNGSVLNLAEHLGVSVFALVNLPYLAVLAARDELRGDAGDRPPLMMFDPTPGAVFMTAEEAQA